MSKKLPDDTQGCAHPDLATWLENCDAQFEQLYAKSSAAHWGLPRESFAAALLHTLQKRFGGERPSPQKLQELLTTLHLEDLALACACAEGCEAAWDHFVSTYRAYLRAAASTVLRCASGSSQAQELADSLFAELYGLGDSKPGRGSLLRYFHGRSSLKTWLRAVLAQRYIDSVRASRRFESFEDDEALREKLETPRDGASQQPADPHRHRYLEAFRLALDDALRRLDPRDAERLRFYYAEELTLAEIGRRLGEHESSVSRNLDRARSELRAAVEETLRNGQGPVNGSGGKPGLSDAEIALCFEYAANDAPIDLSTLFPRRNAPGQPTGRRGT